MPNTSSNNPLCESFVSKNANDISNGNVGITLSLNKQSEIFLETGIEWASIEDFKTAVNETKLYYQLETPTEIDLTDAEVQAFKDLYTYSPTTVVGASSDQLTPYIEFELS